MPRFPAAAPKAAAGELVVMVGGDEATYEEAAPVIATYSNLTVHLGPVGAGQQAKLLNNAVFAAHIALAHDLFDVGRRLGLDAATLGEILRSGSGRSYGLELFVNVGSLEPMTRSPLRPALTKDVELLTGMLEGWEEGATLLAPANKFIDDLGQRVPERLRHGNHHRPGSPRLTLKCSRRAHGQRPEIGHRQRVLQHE